jgi:Protein of unknown function (DUF3467)
VQQRIVMTPTHAKLFLKALEENVKRYEDKFEEIEIPQRPPSLADQLFQSVAEGEDDE